MVRKDSSGDPSLYRRIGGYDVIAAIVDDFFAAMRADPRFARFGTGRGTDSKQRAQQLTVEQLCALSGGPCVYIGRDMRTSHAGLGVTEAEWEASLQLLANSLDRFGIPPREHAEFVALFSAYRDDIVEGSVP
jgi:hemoglobin